MNSAMLLIVFCLQERSTMKNIKQKIEMRNKIAEIESIKILIEEVC